MRTKRLALFVLASVLFVFPPVSGYDALDRNLSIPGVVNDKWTKNSEGYGRKAPVTNIGDWMVFAVDTVWEGQSTILVRRLTLLDMKSGEHTVKVEDCYLYFPDKIFSQELKIRPYEFPLGWDYPVRAARQKQKECKLTLADKEVKTSVERLFYQDSAGNFFHEIYYWDEKLPFGAPVKRIRTGPFDKSGTPKAGAILQTQIFRVLEFGDAAKRGPFEPKKHFPPDPLPFKFDAKPNDWIAVARYSGALPEPFLKEIVFITYEGLKQNAQGNLKQEAHSFRIERENQPEQNLSLGQPESLLVTYYFSMIPTWTMEIGPEKIKTAATSKQDTVKYLLSGSGALYDVWLDKNITFGFPAVIEMHKGHAIAKKDNLMILARSQKDSPEKPRYETLREQWLKTYPPKTNKELQKPELNTAK